MRHTSECTCRELLSKSAILSWHCACEAPGQCCCKDAIRHVGAAELVAGMAQAAALIHRGCCIHQLHWSTIGQHRTASRACQKCKEWHCRRRRGWQQGQRQDMALGYILTPASGQGGPGSGQGSSGPHRPAPANVQGQIRAAP